MKGMEQCLGEEFHICISKLHTLHVSSRKDIVSLNANIFFQILLSLILFIVKKKAAFAEPTKSVHFSTLVGVSGKAYTCKQGGCTRCLEQGHTSFKDELKDMKFKN